jgi:hypothetical protein
MHRVGQNHIYIRSIFGYLVEIFLPIYGHIRGIYTVLANPRYAAKRGRSSAARET